MRMYIIGQDGEISFHIDWPHSALAIYGMIVNKGSALGNDDEDDGLSDRDEELICAELIASYQRVWAAVQRGKTAPQKARQDMARHLWAHWFGDPAVQQDIAENEGKPGIHPMIQIPKTPKEHPRCGWGNFDDQEGDC